MKEAVIEYCIDFIKRDEVKQEIKNIFKPIISVLLQEIYPYIYLSLLLVVISFFLVLGIFILMLRTTKSSN